MKVAVVNYARITCNEQIISGQERLIALFLTLTYSIDLVCYSNDRSMSVSRCGSGYLIFVSGKNIPNDKFLTIPGEEINASQTLEILLYFFHHQLLHPAFGWIEIGDEE